MNILSLMNLALWLMNSSPMYYVICFPTKWWCFHSNSFNDWIEHLSGKSHINLWYFCGSNDEFQVETVMYPPSGNDNCNV